MALDLNGQKATENASTVSATDVDIQETSLVVTEQAPDESTSIPEFPVVGSLPQEFIDLLACVVLSMQERGIIH